MYFFGEARIFGNREVTTLYGQCAFTKWGSEKTQLVKKTAQCLELIQIN